DAEGEPTAYDVEALGQDGRLDALAEGAVVVRTADGLGAATADDVPETDDRAWVTPANVEILTNLATRVVYPETYGATPGVSGAAAVNALAINEAIQSAVNNFTKCRVELDGKVYHVDQTVGIDVAADTSARVHIAGQGRRATVISWLGAAGGTVMRFRTTVGNLRDIGVDDLMITGVNADIGLSIDSCSYNLFRNVTVRDCDLYAVESINNSGRNTMKSLWVVHLDDGNALRVISGNVYLVNPLIGEDAGGIYVAGTL